MNRDVIFSDSCIKNEIKEHVYGYLWSKKYNVNCPVAFKVYAEKETKNKKSKYYNKKIGFIVRDKCKTIDINEKDAYSWFQRVYFGYFDGIRANYLFTKYDPYYNSKIHARYPTYKNGKWGKV